jgi:hypothetical protein
MKCRLGSVELVRKAGDSSGSRFSPTSSLLPKLSLVHDYFPNFAGGPVECRMAIEVLDILKEEKLADNSE